MTLDKLNAGETCVIHHIEESSHLYRRFLDLGMIPGTKVSCVLDNPLGDPKAYEIRGAVIAIRKKDASQVNTESVGE